MSARSGLVGKKSSRPYLGPSEAIFSMDRKNPKKCKILPIFAYFPGVGPLLLSTLRKDICRSKGPCDVFGPWVRWERGQVGIWEFFRRRRRRLEIWEPGNLGFWEFGDLGTWKSRNFEIWGPGNPEFWDPKNQKNKKSQKSNPFCPKCRQGLD